MKRFATLVPVLAAFWPATVNAAPTPWTFDFDPGIAQDPAYVEAHLQDLASDLPGLPDHGIVELATGPVQLYFFDDVADALLRARDAGPAVLPPVSRPSAHCVLHSGFVRPSLLVGGPSSQCLAAEQAAMATFDPPNLLTCTHVEFPETYVYEHSPVGYVDINTVSTFESLISFAGEALTHVDYPEGLLPNEFITVTREVIAKVRYDSLKQELGFRINAYQSAKTQLQSNSTCFVPSALGSFLATVDGLTAELHTVEGQLDALYQAGIAQATLDQQTLAANGRVRADVPFPALADRERELLAFYIGGLYWRMRGAGLIAVPPDPEQGLLRRLLYTQYPYQQIGDLSGGVDADGVGLSVFIQENYGYAEWFDMGRSPGNDKYADLVEMTNRGKVAIALVAPQLAQRGFDVRHLVAGGLQMGPCYYYIWEELAAFRLGPDLQDPYMQFLELPTATGEFCTGAALALGLTRTLLWGKPGTACIPDCATKPCGSDDGCGGVCAPCGEDAAVPPVDGGTLPDGAVPPGSDGGSLPPDSSTVGATEASDDSSGCQCTAGGHRAGNPAKLSLLRSLWKP